MKKRIAKTISFLELIKKFPNNKSVIKFLEKLKWSKVVFCPRCKNKKGISQKATGDKFCNYCRKEFNIKTNTLMQGTRVPLNKWIYAIYFIVTDRKGISSLELSKKIDVTQTTAWLLNHKIREACKGDNNLLKGFIEVDETYIGGIEKNKHESKKHNAWSPKTNKTIVIGMRERVSGETKATIIEDITTKTLQEALDKNITRPCIICTDELKGYKGTSYKRMVINHSAKEYVNGLASTNSIESVWALLKRGYKGVYHNFSLKHLQRYIDEFTFRLNDGNCKIDTIDRITSLINNLFNKTLTYKELVK